MLIRPTVDATYECITQEHHAVLSGMLAAAWRPTRLDPLLVQAIGMHDTPWREADADPRLDPERGLPHDFITFPMDDKIALYRRGIDALEAVHPWIAYLVSKHYTTFSGTRDVARLQEPEQRRRARLEGLLPQARVDAADDALAWIKLFDIFSLHLCLTGPRAQPAAIPRWLSDPDKWSTAPDGTPMTLRWSDDATLTVEPWPFVDDDLAIDLYHRRLEGTSEDATTLEKTWNLSHIQSRTLTLKRP
jgi:hypothetical protein